LFVLIIEIVLAIPREHNICLVELRLSKKDLLLSKAHLNVMFEVITILKLFHFKIGVKSWSKQYPTNITNLL